MKTIYVVIFALSMCAGALSYSEYIRLSVVNSVDVGEESLTADSKNFRVIEGKVDEFVVPVSFD